MKKYLLICLSSLFFIGCASVSPTAYVDKLLDQGDFARLYYYVVVSNDKNVDQAKFKNAILAKTGGAKSSSFFNLAAEQINIEYHPHVDYFIDAHKFIEEARKDNLITEEQARQLNELLKDNLEKKFFDIPDLANSTEIEKLWPDIKANFDGIFQEQLRNLNVNANSNIESFFPIYIYFQKSKNELKKAQTLAAMQTQAEKTIARSKNLTDLNPVFKFINLTGDRSFDAKIISSIKNMNLKKSEMNNSVKELFPDFYKEYISQIKINKKQKDMNRGASYILIEACNGIKDDAKRLSCLQEIISNKTQNLAQLDNNLQDLKKAFASISGAVNSGINFQNYQAISLEPSKALSVFLAINKDVEPEVIEYLTKSAEAYKDAETLWRAHIYRGQDAGIMFGRILNYRMAGLDWLVKKYQLPTNTVLFNENVPLNPSLSIIWREANTNATKAMELLDD